MRKETVARKGSVNQNERNKVRKRSRGSENVNFCGPQRAYLFTYGCDGVRREKLSTEGQRGQSHLVRGHMGGLMIRDPVLCQAPKECQILRITELCQRT